MSKGPSKGIEVDPDEADDTSSRGAAHVSVIDARKAQIQSEIEHGGSLDGGTNEQWKTTADAVDKVCNVEDCSCDLDGAVDTGCQ